MCHHRWWGLGAQGLIRIFCFYSSFLSTLLRGLRRKRNKINQKVVLPNPLPHSCSPLMTSLHTDCHSHPRLAPDFAISPPTYPVSRPSRRPISDPPPSGPLPCRSLSQITHLSKSDADSSPWVPTLLDANPSAPSSRPHVSHRKSSPRSQTLPSTHSTVSDLTFPTSHCTPKPLSRRSSSSSTASSSSDTSPPPSSHIRTPQYNPAGIGRKVADSLQLFKESVSLPETEVINPLAFARACSPSHRRISSHAPSDDDDDDDVIGPHFEFVKRADWQEREAATHRRERSMLTIEMARARETIIGVSQERRQSQSHRKELPKDAGLDDRTLYSKDSPRQRDTRGRARDRQQQSSLAFPSGIQPIPPASSYHDLTPIVTSPPRSYPLSPSPCPPSNCISLPASQFQPSPDFRSPAIPTTSHHIRDSVISHSRSPTPICTVPRLPAGVHTSTPSPWTTDDESAWESASVTSTASISSPVSPPEPIESNPDVTWPTDNEYDISSRTPVDDDIGVNDRYHAQFEPSEDVLPHIPLRPFRNQVGGHTSIYKFTKRAVCKVRLPLRFFLMINFLTFYPKCKASSFKGESVLRNCRT